MVAMSSAASPNLSQQYIYWYSGTWKSYRLHWNGWPSLGVHVNHFSGRRYTDKRGVAGRWRREGRVIAGCPVLHKGSSQRQLPASSCRQLLVSVWGWMA